jgi:hypothetical protein
LLNVKEVDAVSGSNGPVVVLTRSVDVVERLLLKKSSKAELRSDLFNDLHDDDVLVDLAHGVAEERGKLVLVRSNLTVSGTKWDTELKALVLDLLHACKSRGSGRRRSHVVVAHFLSTSSILSDDGTASELKVRALEELFTRDEEDLLFETNVGLEARNLEAEKVKKTLSFAVQGIHRAEEGGFFIKGVSVVRHEAGRDENGVITKPDRRSRVNLQVTASGMCSTKTSVRVGGSIGLTGEKILALKVPHSFVVGIELKISASQQID